MDELQKMKLKTKLDEHAISLQVKLMRKLATMLTKEQMKEIEEIIVPKESVNKITAKKD